MSPTITSPAATRMGVILGTAAYMAPEQARGRPVDKRADIWAFGCVLFEMLTGKVSFAGSDVGEVLAGVIKLEPNWASLPHGTPSTVAAVLRRCLEKDPRQRLRDIGDVRLLLGGALSEPTSETVVTALRVPVWRRLLVPGVAAVLAALVTAGAFWQQSPTPPAAGVTVFSHEITNGLRYRVDSRPRLAMAPDGRSFVYIAASGGQNGLFVRRLDDLQPRLLPGTRNAQVPFFSPDGNEVAFFVNGELQKVALAGGEPMKLCDAALAGGGAWGTDGTILFAERSGIMRVSAAGGKPDLVVPAAKGEEMFGPSLLPGGDAVLFTVTTAQGLARWEAATLAAHSFTTGQRTVLVTGGSDGRYLPSGHLVYAVRDQLLGVAFDAKRLEVSGGAAPLRRGLAQTVGVSSAGASFGVSRDGSLVYAEGPPAERTLEWVDRDGRVTKLSAVPSGDAEDPRLSPDGSRAVVTQGGDMWVYELASGRRTRVTANGGSLGVWDPTGRQIAYSVARGGDQEAWVAAADGSGEARQLTHLGGVVHVDAWSRDGRWLTVHQHPPGGGSTLIFVLSMTERDGQPTPFAAGQFNAESMQFSPDGRYVTFLSMQSGQREIYIRPYPGPGEQVTVSIGGGQEPIWAANGELFYRSRDGTRMFSVAVTTTPTLKVGAPVERFSRPYYLSPTGSPRAQYDVTSDGRRLLMVSSGEEAERGLRLIVVSNWIEELKRLVPTE